MTTIKRMQGLMAINCSLTKSTLEITENLLLIEERERALYNSSDTVELYNGSILNRYEQLAYFKKIYELAVANDACDKVELFRSFYKSGDYYSAWCNVIGEIEWLDFGQIISHSELPKSITIGKKWYMADMVEEKYVFKGGIYDGDYVSFFANGQVWTSCSYQNNISTGTFTRYAINGQKMREFSC